MTSSPRLPLLAGLPLAVGAGLAIPVQGRINGALGTRLDDGIAAAVVSFSTGLVVMVLVSLLLPSGRAGRSTCSSVGMVGVVVMVVLPRVE